MIIDLIIIGVVGCIIEALGIFVFNKMIFASVISSSFSLLIMLLVTTRWGLKGLILAPFLALATVISGRFFIENPDLRPNYGWELYIASTASLLSFAVNHFWFKKKNYRETYRYTSNIFILVLIDIVVSLLTLSIVYLIFKQTFQLLGFVVWNAFSYIVLCVGAFALRGMGVMVDVKQNIIDNNEIARDEMSSFSFDDEEEENSKKEEGELKDE